jgi:hypothetical protein
MSKLKKEVDLEKLPNPRLHQIISFIKSGIRIVAYVYAFQFNLVIAAGLLLLSRS